ncbi:MAG: serine protease, partial [Sphingobacteriales bacterium]
DIQHYDELKDGIILSINNTKAENIETVTEILSRKGPNQRVRVEMLTKNREVVRFLM